MLFWTRSFLCIGAVVFLVTGRSPSDVRDIDAGAVARNLAGSGGRIAIQLCQERPGDCARALKQSLAAAATDKLPETRDLLRGASPARARQRTTRGVDQLPAL